MIDEKIVYNDGNTDPTEGGKYKIVELFEDSPNTPMTQPKEDIYCQCEFCLSRRKFGYVDGFPDMPNDHYKEWLCGYGKESMKIYWCHRKRILG